MTNPEDQRASATVEEQRASSQARRDRARITEAQAEIAALRSKVLALEHAPSRRLFAPARAVLRRVRALRPAPAVSLPTTPAPVARGLALVLEHNWPQPDRDSGSVDIVNLVQALARLGFDTILAASHQHEGDQPARDRLAAQGVHCLQPAEAASVEHFIQTRGGEIAVCVMCRVFCGGEFLEALQRHARQARLVFNSIDLNFLREERRATFMADEALLAIARQVRGREEHLIRSSDATLVVSEAERELLAAIMPEAFAVQLPLARRIRAPGTGWNARTGIGFIGGFAHAPNIDAVRYFLADIWPHVQEALPGCELAIVGPDAPADLAAGASNVRILGHLPDLDSWFDSIRLTVAPLRYGAGAKGKVASSLANGVPCIVTNVASEGMSLTDTDGILTADTPEAFAAAVARAYNDEALWSRLSTAALAYAERTLSIDAWETRLDAVMRRLGL